MENELKDSFLSEMLSKTGEARAPEGFSEKVMEKIRSEAKPGGVVAWLREYYPYFSGAAAFIVIVVVFYFFRGYISGLLDPLNQQTEDYREVFSAFYAGFSWIGTLLKGVFSSSVSLISILSLLMFFVADLILKGIFKTRNAMLLV